jgi:hypothetical protein
LIAMVRPRRSWRWRPVAQLAGQPAQRGLHGRRGGDVGVERRLPRLRDRHAAFGGHLAAVLEARPPAQPGTHAATEARAELLVARGCERPERGQPHRRQALHGAWADTGHEAGGRAGEARARLLAGEHHEARGLLGVRGDLRHQLVGPDADRDAQARALADVGHQAAHRRVRRDEPREVGVGLVQADDLDALDLLAHDPHDGVGDFAVGAEVRRDDDGLGTEPPGT